MNSVIRSVLYIGQTSGREYHDCCQSRPWKVTQKAWIFALCSPSQPPRCDERGPMAKTSRKPHRRPARAAAIAKPSVSAPPATPQPEAAPVLPDAGPPHLPSQPPQPTHRLLRGYAFDPSLATQLETALVSEITYKVPWEELEPRPDRRVHRGGRLRPAERLLLRAGGSRRSQKSWRRTAWPRPRAIRSSISRWSTPRR